MRGDVHFLQIPTPKVVFSVKSSNSANDGSNSRLSGSSSAERTGDHLYWICTDRWAVCIQIVLESEIVYTL